MHLGPEAMKIIGESIAHDIAANRENSWFAHDIEITYEDAKDSSPLREDPPPESPPIESPANTFTEAAQSLS